GAWIVTLQLAHFRQRLGLGDLVPGIETEHADVHRIEPAGAVPIENVAVGHWLRTGGAADPRQVDHAGMVETRRAREAGDRRRRRLNPAGRSNGVDGRDRTLPRSDLGWCTDFAVTRSRARGRFGAEVR